MADGSPDDTLDALEAVGALEQERIIYAGELAAAFSTRVRPWDSRRAKRFLKRSGIGFQLGGKAGKWVTTSKRLREDFPQLWDLIVARDVDAL